MIKYPAMSRARLKMLSDPGHIYAAYSRYCDWVKVGFTSKPVHHRLEAAASQYPEFAPFSLIGVTRATWSAEQQVHYLLSPFRHRRTGRTKELYPAVPSLVSLVEEIVSHPQWDRLPYEKWKPIIDWARRIAKAPANHDPAMEAFERFYADQRAA